jgi:outer membrane protein TolC
VSAASLLASQQALLQSSLALAQAEGSRYANYFALVQALGGGWWDMAQADGYASALPARRPAE